MTRYKNSSSAFRKGMTEQFAPGAAAKPKKKRIYDRNERSYLGLPILEDDMHQDVITACRAIKYKNTNVTMFLHHSPNGGFRNKPEAARFKAMGTLKGFPDLFLFIANPLFHGLFIELKVGKNTVTDEQASIHRLLEEQGYKVVVCYTVQGVVNAINDYLEVNYAKSSR